MPPLDALTGEHEEEDGKDQRGSVHLPPQQHGWTDDEDVSSCQSTAQPAMSIFEACHLDIFPCSYASSLGFLSMGGVGLVRNVLSCGCFLIGGDSSVVTPGQGRKKKSQHLQK